MIFLRFFISRNSLVSEFPEISVESLSFYANAIDESTKKTYNGINW